MESLNKLISFIQNRFNTDDFIPLHAPVFWGNEKKYLADCIDSTFVSSVGPFVDQFEKMMLTTVGTDYAIATTNGTSALHTALLLASVGPGDEVLTQSLTFVATANAIHYCNASPVFLDSDLETFGLCPEKLELFLNGNTFQNEKNQCINKNTKKIIKACVPMHVFGHACKIDQIVDICHKNNILVIEDAAEALGSKYKGKALGSFGDLSIFSFNGNKIATGGGGGAVCTNNHIWAKKGKHLTTTGKVPHSYDFYHDMIAYNYRLPNINAALICAQLENLQACIDKKRMLASEYIELGKSNSLNIFSEPKNCLSNYWLNSIILNSREQRDLFLKELNGQKILARPVWNLMHKLPFNQSCQTDNLENALFLEERIINIPSGVII